MTTSAARTGQTVPLFTPAPARAGRQRLALDRTIRWWARHKHLTGSEHAATLEFLRGLADQLDHGWTPQTARTYAAALAAAQPPAAPVGDPRHAGLTSAAEQILADLEANDPH